MLPISGRWSGRRRSAAAITCWAACSRPSTAWDRNSSTIAGLQKRIAAGGITEVILAIAATVDGQTTAHYVADRLESSGAAITRLAHGVPVGGELDYLDDGTITQALKARRPV